ncbi:DinB family protein [Latilactobacillus fuchuensis]|uniref:DinB-like domain-containing protein n=1 Tax=Latilactobacillus fuchuensis DSM 14340 = JCM 11249 TaxID=1423747 RepID=A0A0R1RXS2_9LACO|nr:DUF664 domain-containing protein [Latilactobacillus fuchuensis]KRL61257.1 hypothetical protein FC69_GL000906 [Latilactobacillus fuchuensis DSM 14340 = JCM 11249]MCP8858423.1 DUF664 domain-containing protein [Latilactobacillus fuchuensis]
MKMTQLSIETLARAEERLLDTLTQMTVDEANTMPQPLIKSVTWLTWHTAREMDYQISDLKNVAPLWQSAGWNQRFGLVLPDDTQDWCHTPEEAVKVVVDDKQLLIDYLAAAVQLTNDYLMTVDETTLADVIDDSWTPAVTRQARLVSIIDDAVMHSGQAVYTRRLVIGR